MTIPTNPHGAGGVSPWDLRAEIVERVTADLLGPLEGDHEIISGYLRSDGSWSSPGRVRDRYLVGMLAPKGTIASDPERDDGTGPEDNEDTAAGDERVPRAAPARSSVGLTAVVDPTVAVLTARCRWGQYTKEHRTQPDGARAAVWAREPRQVDIEVPLREGELGPLPVDGDGIIVRGRAARSAEDGCWLVSVFVSNERAPAERNKDSRWMFQAALEVFAADGAAVFMARPQPPGMPDEHLEVQHLDMLYRDIAEFAAGHGAGVDAEVSHSDPRRAVRVATTTIPAYETPRTDAPQPADEPHLGGLITDMKTLSDLVPEQLRVALAPLADGYRAWLDDQQTRVSDPDARLDGHEHTARTAIAEARRVADGVAAGIDLVCSDTDALDAFRFANQAMWRQRVHTVATEARRRDPDLTLRQAVNDADVARNRSWRPFQLAFILLCVPSLTDPAHPDRSPDQPEKALADLLFFPTGGGKTEAYLGLVAYTLAVRRIQGIIGEHTDEDSDDVVDGRAGVAVLMRYTLRLLTAQQFQRAAALICAAELLRQHRARSDDRYAGVPFRLGMWVGSAVTPNQSSDAETQLEQTRLAGRRTGRASALQLTDCPWCGHPITTDTDCRYDPATRRFQVFCGNAAECPFTQSATAGEGIPVVTVDEEIYRLLPAFVIATIDKFAQLPWNGATSLLFGRVTSRCTRHGYRNPDLDASHRSRWVERDSHKARDGHLAARTETVTRLRPPDLIIQDEMHLITGPLGTMAGLYETAIDRLTTWEHKGRAVRPKVVASTATTRRARQQTWSVFWRDLRVFPPPVLDAARSFFAEQTPPSPQSPGRLYLGICAHGERLKQVQLRVFASMMAAAQATYERLGTDAAAADPWMTTVGYFNAVRELAGMRRMAEDELRAKLRRAGLTPGLASRLIFAPKELTSRVSADDIKSILRQLFVTHDPARPDDSERPIDLLLATNMISVGVDVPRLASMIVVGQPKATAEYIQATSRVGRDPAGPGLVITLYNWARPRDLSHYETFNHYHATFYRHVEPLSVTPFSRRALDKGLTGVLVAAVRHDDTVWNPNPTARNLVRSDPRLDAHVKAITARAGSVTSELSAGTLAEDMANTRLDDWQRKTVLKPDLSYTKRTGADVALLVSPEAGDWGMWTCPNSLRDTEAQANIQIVEHDPTYEAGQPDYITGPRTPTVRTVTAADEEIHEAVEADDAQALASGRRR